MASSENPPHLHRHEFCDGYGTADNYSYTSISYWNILIEFINREQRLVETSVSAGQQNYRGYLVVQLLVITNCHRNICKTAAEPIGLGDLAVNA